MARGLTGASPIPITVFTGFLGAGKTSIILSLLARLPEDYKLVLLKNEFGDVEVDSKLAQQSSLTAVSEILNGCMCCVLVGQMQTALLEIRDKYRPHRIIIECSGSAFPATLAFQIRELERQTEGDLKLDAIVTVIDTENFCGYEDTSPTAKMQASYTDILLINKWEHVSEQTLDNVMEHLNTLNDLTPKIRCEGRSGVDPNLIFGVDTKLFLHNLGHKTGDHHNEVETITIYRGSSKLRLSGHDHCHGDCACDTQMPAVNDEHCDGSAAAEEVKEGELEAALKGLAKEYVWRVKGLVNLRGQTHILNWAFGRYELTKLVTEDDFGGSIKCTVMGERGELRRAIRQFCTVLRAEIL